jgi:tetratricopeptide (TPR) repeat protein
MKRLRDWILQTWWGRLIAIAVPLIVSVLTAYFLNRVASFDYVRIWHSWEFYVIVALVVLTVASTVLDQTLRAAAERRRKEKIGSAEIHRTRNFTGRDADLAKIETALKADPLAVVICGPRGIGKSVLAREYAHRNRRRFTFAWWLNARTEDGVIEGLVALSAYLSGVSEVVADRRVAAELARDSLADLPKPVLLVFDDLEDEFLLRWKPESGARVLATSNKSAATWSGDITTVPLGLWSPDEATQYLLNECKSRKIILADAMEIARTLDRLPLALSHAASYLRGTTSATVSSYLEHITEHLAEVPPDADYPNAVFATFQASVARAEREAPGAAAILCLASFFAADAIPIELFQQDSEVYAVGLRPVLGPDGTAGRDLRSTLLDAIGFEKVLGALDRFSLVAFFREARAVTVHRLVQLVARAAVEHDRPRWAESAVAALDDAFPDVEPSASGACDRLLPHAYAALDAIPKDTAFTPAGWLALSCGDCLYGRSETGDAEPMYRFGLAVLEAGCGPNHADVSIALQKLAWLLYRSARLAEAEQLLRRGLAIVEASYGHDDPAVARIVSNLANVIGETDRLAEAEQLHRRALAIEEASDGPDHPRVATCLNNLAIVLSDRNRPAEAERLYRRALTIREACYGPVHPLIASNLSNLADLLRKTNRPAEAERLHRRALAIDEATYGPNHPEVAVSLQNLAIVLNHAKRNAEAERLYRRALAIQEGHYGLDHAEVASVLLNIGVVLSETARPREAEQLYLRALVIFEKTYGTENRRVAVVLHNLANVLSGTSRSAEAEELYRRSLRLDEMSFGPNSPETATTLFNLANLLRVTDSQEAERLYGRAIAIREACYGSHDPRTVRYRDVLASLLRTRSR